MKTRVCWPLAIFLVFLFSSFIFHGCGGGSGGSSLSSSTPPQNGNVPPQNGNIHKFIQTFFLRYDIFYPGDEVQAAKCDFVITGRGDYNNINGNTWSAIKAINPSSQIYSYQFSTAVATNEDTYPTLWCNNLARWNVSRGHSMGSLFGDNPGFFVYKNGSTSSDDIITDSYDMKYLKFGLPDYQKYFLEGTLTDLANQAWSCDGVFLDGPYVGYSWPLFDNTEYASADVRIPAMISFVENIVNGLHKNGQLCAANLGGGESTTEPTGTAAWISIDENADHPDVGLEEGTFCNGWNGTYISFPPETRWKSSVDVLSQIHNMRVAYYNGTSNVISPTNPDGLDNYGKPVNYYDAFWFAFASFLIGKNDIDNNSYFGFSTSSSTGGWYDEYNIDLGKSLGTYQITNQDGTNIYWREFEKGYVFVNPTNTDVTSIPLPQTVKQLNHDNFASDWKTLADVSAISLIAHRGTILVKDSAISGL